MWRIKFIFVFAIPFSIMITLGTWQVFRLKEKNIIIHNMQALPVKLSSDNLVSQRYNHVIANGSFDNDHKFFVFAGTLGYYVLQPFHLNDGKYILINKGTIADRKKELKLFDNDQRSVTGILYCDHNKKVGWFVKNDIDDNLWFWFDIEAMTKTVNIPLESCIIWANDTVDSNGITINVPLKVRNDHLEYIITWYVLALVWLVGYLYWCRSKTT
ncbi:Surf1-like protein [Ehrlichia ruminantium]|uniref:SURF1 family protein n=1 Tax=Ehrlichia ruminantium TaxID=779 RepID=UPI0007C12003|nr:SURF1 family protein [Ehrlichia ruminantium]QLK52759.1 SURF1 family protein [Ehrlichia ruminantium]QLK53681.1 SURF1 family protein [Ehrlichia ruminantium]QLK54594.1 SURF1 family protein [Ehrlichia ruminantium]QLK57342.1 SURF1 family protein [Ehrlichia ruminantium]QLK58259.1 SURF1 family protein [Ehrlichia ruminantium]